MGIQVKIGEYTFEALNYSVTEEATPLSAGDSIAGVSVMRITIPRPDPHTSPVRLEDPITGELTPVVADTGADYIRKFGAELLRDLPVRLTDTRKGFIVGAVDAVRVDDQAGTIEITCLSKMGALAANNIRALPYSGTLGGAFAYYLSLAGITDTNQFRADPEISDRQVAYIGWLGELWQHLKMMAAAEDCEVTLVSGVIVLRPVRTRQVIRGRSVARGRGSSVEQAAQAVEVYSYGTSPVVNGLVYPAGGPNTEEQILTVAAGETVEYTIELGASVESIIPPIPEDAIQRGTTTISGYRITDDGGYWVPAARWTRAGGWMEVEVNPDTITATVRLHGATLVNSENMPIPSYSIAIGGSGVPMSSLRILGTGVLFNPVKHRIRNGETPAEAATDVGVTVDNPFIRNASQAARVGLRAARRYARMSPSTSGEVISVSRRGDRGGALTPTYGEVMQEVYDALGTTTPTWAQAAAYYESLGLSTLGDIQNYYRERAADSFDEQVFGNVQGARYWDDETRRWYRIRSASISPSTISFDAEEDLTVADMQELYEGMTYAEVQAIFEGMTYRQAGRMGMYRG